MQKKHQKAGFKKYLYDAMGETNETVVSLSQCKDIYYNYLDVEVIKNVIKEYEIIGKQLFRLQESWSKFSNPRK
ncbi:MAG: four helix bundle protein [Saprospiraceae bacterium]